MADAQYMGETLMVSVVFHAFSRYFSTVPEYHADTGIMAQNRKYEVLKDGFSEYSKAFSYHNTA